MTRADKIRSLRRKGYSIHKIAVRLGIPWAEVRKALAPQPPRWDWSRLPHLEWPQPLRIPPSVVRTVLEREDLAA